MASVSNQSDDLYTLFSTVVAQVPVEYCEVRWEETSYTRFIIRDGDVEQVEENELGGGCVRALVQGAWGVATFTNPAHFETSINLAIKLAQLSAQHSNRVIRLAETIPQQARVTFPIQEDPCSLLLASKLALFTEYDRYARTLPNIEHCVCRYFDEAKRTVLVTSNGTHLIQNQTDLYGSLTLSAFSQGKNLSVPVYGGSSNDFGALRNLQAGIKLAGEHLTQLQKVPSVQTNTYPVVIGPELASLLVHEAFGHFSEADNQINNPQLLQLMQKGRSLANRCLNIFDSGLEVGTRGFVPFDDEGVPGQRTDLIREGKLVGRLHSRETAAWFGEQPTGNARAVSFRFPPICRMRTINIGPGDTPYEDMIRRISLGVYADGPYGGKVDGENFSFVALKARMIRHGQLAEHVGPVNLTGSIFRTWANIEAVGTDYLCKDTAGGCGKGGQGPLRVSAGAPHLLVKELLVTPR